MTDTQSRWTQIAGALLLVLAVLVGVQACGVESPVTPEATGGEEVEIPAPSPQDQIDEPSASAGPTFTPFTAAPSLANREEVLAAMEAEYPPLLREAGVGGMVRVYFFIDEEGAVRDARVDQSSGHEALDQAALRVARAFEFDPALNGSKPVPVWVSFPIRFQSSAGGG